MKKFFKKIKIKPWGETIFYFSKLLETVLVKKIKFFSHFKMSLNFYYQCNKIIQSPVELENK